MELHKNLTTSDIIERIRQANGIYDDDARPASDSIGGIDYFANRDSFKDITKRKAGATLLNNKECNVILKAVAPMAHDDCQVRGDLPITGENKALAATPASQTNGVADSLHSPSDEDNELMDDAVPLEDEAVLADDELFDPDFYKMRIDLFDNGAQANKTQWTAKITALVNPDSDPENPYVMVANYYSRSRDFRSAIKKRDMWCSFYDEVEAVFEEHVHAGLDYKVKPMIAILKEQVKHKGGKPSYLPIGYTASIMYQEHGCDPVVWVIYQNFLREVYLDQAFTVQKASKLYKIGIYRDPTRVHLEPRKDKPIQMVVRKPGDFGK